jgi:hypothetical protein
MPTDIREMLFWESAAKDIPQKTIIGSSGNTDTITSAAD